MYGITEKLNICHVQTSFYAYYIDLKFRLAYLKEGVVYQ
jgi:hypothetical protein